MATNHQHLPPEVVEIIISLATHASNSDINKGHSYSRKTLLKCALVCKTWLWPARRLLQSLHLDLEHVSIVSARIVTFSNIFGSPLCTLDSGLIQTLSIRPDKRSRNVLHNRVPFLVLSSALDNISFSSLHTILFYNISLVFNKDDNNFLFSGSTTIWSAVKTLSFKNLINHDGEFEHVVHAASLFPSLETLIAQRTFWDKRRTKKKKFFHPPTSLRKLEVDTLTFQRVMDWLEAGEFDLSRITSVFINEKFTIDEDVPIRDRTRQGLDLLGPNLQEFGLCRPPTPFSFP